MLGNSVEINFPLNHFVLGAHLAPGEKRLVCIPVCNVPYPWAYILTLYSDGFFLLVDRTYLGMSSYKFQKILYMYLFV